MRIAIVGATGMLGHHTALAAFRAGHEVIVVYPEVSIDEAIARALKWFQGNGLVKSEIKS